VSDLDLRALNLVGDLAFVMTLGLLAGLLLGLVNNALGFEYMILVGFSSIASLQGLLLTRRNE
jgi:hypothetical protein